MHLDATEHRYTVQLQQEEKKPLVKSKSLYLSGSIILKHTETRAMFQSVLLALVFTISASLITAYAPCPETQSEMSVESVNGIFCVEGYPICNSEIYDGACPVVQEGLPYGSYCGVVASGVYGCKTLNATSVLTYAPAMTPAPTSATPTPATETPAPTPTPSPRPGCEVA